MEQSPSCKANRFAASQENSHILWNLKVHYRIHNCLLPVSILIQLNPVYTPTSYFLRIHINIILSSTPRSPQWSVSLRFPHQNPVHASFLPHSRYMPHRTVTDYSFQLESQSKRYAAETSPSESET
jgi:hypothetical protein